MKEEIQIVDIKEFAKSTWYFREDGIVMARIHPGVNIELEDSIENRKYLFAEKAEYMPLRLMVVAGHGATSSKEVREYSNEPEQTSMIKAEAIVVNHLAHKIIAKFMMNFYKKAMPIKIFDNEDDAIKWLKSKA